MMLLLAYQQDMPIGDFACKIFNLTITILFASSDLRMPELTDLYSKTTKIIWVSWILILLKVYIKRQILSYLFINSNFAV